MKRFLTIFFIGLAGVSYCQDDFDKMLEKEYNYTVPLIQPEELISKIENGITIQLLDTRTVNEYNVSKIKGAIHVGFAGFSPKKVKEVEKDDMIVVYCTIGARSESIGEKLLKKGYSNVHNLYGGIIHWVNEGNPVYSSSNEQTERVHVYSKSWGKWLKKGVPVY